VKNTLLVSGCSFTAGTGFDLEKDEPNLWVNLLHKNIFPQTTLLNVGIPGRSNLGIFHDTLKVLLSDKIKYALVEWTSYPRYNLDLGVETYNTKLSFNIGSGKISQNYTHNDIEYPAEYLEDIKNRFLVLEHDHSHIRELVNYVNILTSVSKLVDCKIFFINGLCSWDKEYFTHLDNCTPDLYTKYTQKILNTENRDDDEILELYNKIHNEYTQSGGIQEIHWLNLYNSLIRNKIDTNNDNIHPGLKSNQLYFNILSQALSQKLS